MSVYPPNFRQALRRHATQGLLACLCLAGCDAEPDKPRPAESADPAAPAEPAEAPVAAAPAPKLADLAARVTAQAQQATEAEAIGLAKVLKAAGADAKVLKFLYNEPRLRFYERDGSLTADGAAVLALLGELERHGVDRTAYRLAQLDAATQRVTEVFAAERQALLRLEPQPRAALVAAAAAIWLRGGDGGEVALVRAGGDKLEDDERRALDRHLAEVMAAAVRAREAVLQADVEVARNVVRYLVDFEHGKPAHPLKYTPPAQIRKMAETHADKLIERLSLARGKTADALRAVWPTHPQYAPLLVAVDSYSAIATKGGWPALPKLPGKKVQKGDSGPFVLALRERLRAEGYEAGEGELFDETLHEAVVAFQSRHQLDTDGIVSRTTVAELDVPADQRLRQLKLALQRYRESEARDPENFHLWVNIAFQKLWVMEHGKTLRTHRVVVGNNDTDVDYQTQLKGKINRTKMFSKPMERIILAPRWYPTKRVVELEINPALAKEPDYLEKHGYVREMQADGTEVVYQKAGKENLLGEVKFQGQNKYNIYLHDTNARALFGRARRAYSHGCIRLQDPIDLAERLLDRDRGMSPAAIRAAIKEKEEKIVMLKTPVPVHIDYVSAGVDENGEVAFGADVYGYDQAFFDGQLPVEEAKEYKAASVKGL